jgi:hypothetical protein
MQMFKILLMQKECHSKDQDEREQDVRNSDST